MNSDLVKLRSKVVHPVANNPLTDELALPFKPDLQILVWFLLLPGFLTSLDFACSTNFSSGSCQISCARSVSRTSKCKVFTLDSEAPEFGLQLRQSQWSQQSSSAFPPGRASDPHTWTTSAPSQGLWNISATNRTWCWGGFSSSTLTRASRKIHHVRKGRADRSPWLNKY